MNSDQGTLAARLAQLADEAGNVTALARICGIPQRTMAGWVAGDREPKISDAAQIATRTGIRLEWLATGVEPMRHGEEVDVAAGALSSQPSQPINRQALMDVIRLVEEWLRRNKRDLSPDKKAEVFTELYEMSIENDTDSATTDPKIVGRILRLVS
ncbi:helix-turn-helix domain-containing protein [Azospirillum agricola]|uniref:helix-turn-helix domain-containing protein n=1 Tax=Azospirillum agricola TaxID=1720247 RepID=UPI000A1CD7B9|nr:helix-turn-helix domain-containing protein [Azospirillum agricola]